MLKHKTKESKLKNKFNMNYPVKKLENNGTVMLRDYTIKDCIKKNENMKVTYDGDVMTLTPEELTTKYVSRPLKIYESKFDKGLSYKLIGYDWNPDEIEL